MIAKDIRGREILVGCKIAVATRQGYAKRAVMRYGTVYRVGEKSVGVLVETQYSWTKSSYFNPKNMIVVG